MVPPNFSKIDVIKADSFNTVLAELSKLGDILSEQHLPKFIVFNRAYYIVTKRIIDAKEAGYFSNPEFIEKLTVCFAGYYFKAINDSVTSSKDQPTAWAKLDDVKQNRAPVFLLLLMGANAHINHDLPLALLEVMDINQAKILFGDVRKIDKLLMDSGKEIIGTFKESQRFYDFIKRRFQFLYYRPIMYIILYWRIKAWQNYRSIKTVGIHESNYDNLSVKTANRLLRLGRLLS
jgi:hypothetical protein